MLGALNEKQKQFANEFLVDFKAAPAYIRAGYKATGNSAEVNSTRLLKDPRIQEYIQQRMKDREKRTEITQDRVLREYARLGFFDPRKLFDGEGKPVPINDLDDDTAAALAGLDVQEVYEGFGEDREFVGYTKKYKIADKKGALDSIARHLGMFVDKQEINGTLVIIKGESDLED